MPPMSVDVALVVHEVDHRVRGWSGRTRSSWRPARPSTLRANSMRHHLQAEAQPEAGDAVLAGVAWPRRSCPRCRARRSRRGSPCRRGRRSRPGGEQALDVLGLDPVDLDLGAVVEAGVLAGSRRPTGRRRAGRRTCRSGRCAPAGRPASTRSTTTSHGVRSSSTASRRRTSHTTSSRPSSWRMSGSS